MRSVGYWRAAERLCDVGFLPESGLKPPRADRIYDNGLIAWWPSPRTESGGVQLFLLRYGDHDLAIDPRQLLSLDEWRNRQAVLYVEGLRMAAVPGDVELPAPGTLPQGVTIDRDHGRVLSHFTHSELIPIDVVAAEPIESLVSRHTGVLAGGAGAALALIGAWLFVVLRVSRRELSMASELRIALANNRLSVAYQPVIELASGRCVGAEALVRWTREDGQVVSPAVFVPVAEQAGLIQDLTVAVMRMAVRDLAALSGEFDDISINVNLSPEDLRNDRVDRELHRALEAAGLPPKAIKLEITERALLNTELSRSMIRHFRLRGHSIAVDDFGTGYSSLSYLQSFELDFLKIDKSFVDAIGTGAATSQVIVHVIEMAKSLGLDTVAEGVETREQADWLRARGVPFAQGYLFSKPLAYDAYLEFLRTNRRTA